MKITRRKITASADTNTYDVFMLMDYDPGDAGMESDDFYCYGKFYAKNIEDAKQQLNSCIRKYPQVNADGMYVSEYNEYFDDFDPDDPYDPYSNEVFNNLELLFKRFAQNADSYDEYYGDEDLPFSSTRIESRSNYVSSSKTFEDYADEITQIDQEFTSENTSINSGKVPAVFKMVHFEPGTINLDFGGGKFDTAAEYLTQYDVINLVYDPYNRSSEHNNEVIKTIKDAGGADTATCSNVLNVIKEPEVRANVLQNIKKLVKPNGDIFITVYEGTGKGNEGATKSGYQLNRKTADYLEEIQQVFPDATRRGKLIKAKNASGGGSVNSATVLGQQLDTSNLEDEIYSEAVGFMMMDSDTLLTKDNVDDYIFVDAYPSDDGSATVVELRAELGYDEMLELINRCDPIVAKYDKDAYFDMESPGIAIAYVRNSYIQSASFGGAYDLEDDEFFTKEEIVEWANDVIDTFNLNVPADSQVWLSDIYTEGNMLKLFVENHDTTFDVAVKIDMRKIRKPADISRFTNDVISQLESSFDDFYADMDISSSQAIKAYDEIETAGTSDSDYIQFEINDLIIDVDDSGYATCEDTSYEWAKAVDPTSHDYTSLELDDWDSIADHVVDLIEPNLAAKKGRYSVSGKVTLAYNIHNIDTHITDMWSEGERGRDYEMTTNLDDVDVEFNYDESYIDNLVINPL